MKKLSGWMRLWIVLSTIFLISSSLYGIKVRNDISYDYYQLTFNFCKSDIEHIKDPKEHGLQFDKCLKDSDLKTKEYMDDGNSIPMFILVFSFIPLVLIWILGFISHKLYKWIRKGFVEHSQRTE